MREMEDVVVSSEDAARVRPESEIEKETASGTDGFGKWGRFLPKMDLRVMLVEADDSTRQIISALLRKCSYRVVAVPDGLKAWEILKRKPDNIDLILTEVDLPSISGYPLLTLIMEHEICKNIPVIMMSSRDSISTVYRCMSGGAADYLVKPIRRNELRILWQHVWRRQSSLVGGNGFNDESVGQQKLEVTSENNAASNESSGFRACIQRNKEEIEKGTDAQSSCTRPDLEDEHGEVEIMQDLPWSKSLPSDMKSQMHKVNPDLCRESPILEKQPGGSLPRASEEVERTCVNEDVEPERQRRHSDTGEACNAHVHGNSYREAIDLMGAFRTRSSTSANGSSKFYSPQLLDLSLRRSHPNAFEDHAYEERSILRHSSASAFSRYSSKLGQTQFITTPRMNYEKNICEIVGGYNFNAPGPPRTQKGTASLAVGQFDIQPRLSEATAWTHQSVLPVPFPVKGISVNNLNGEYSTRVPPICGNQTTRSQTPSSSSASQQELTSRANPFHQSSFENNKSEQFYDRLVQNANTGNQNMYKLDQNLKSLEDRGHISTATDQNGSGSLYYGAMNHLNSMGYSSISGSNSNADQVAVFRSIPDNMNEDKLLIPGANSHRSILREAALTKFRMKRKDRCFEKKVRYESRKKLAEQRPRVKGQFVRQLQTEPASIALDNNYGN